MIPLRSPLLVLAIAVLATVSGAFAQQPNSPEATLAVNEIHHGRNSTGPIPVGLLPGGALVLDVEGASGAPFVLASGLVLNVIGGVSVPPLGIIDLQMPADVVMNGFNPVTLVDQFAFVGPSGRWRFEGLVPPLLQDIGLQAAVADVTNPAGMTCTAAVEMDVNWSGNQNISHTFDESVLGDDMTVSWYHQALSFPFYGTVYTVTHIDTNGYVSFGPVTPSRPSATPSALHSGPPTIAPYWCDMHMSSTVASSAGFTSGSPATIEVSETDNGGGDVDLVIEWRWAVEAAGPAVRWDFGVSMDSAGDVGMFFGWLPGQSNCVALVGIGPGYGLSNAPSTTLLDPNGVVPITGGTNEAIFEYFPNAPFPLHNFAAMSSQAHSMTFRPNGPPGAESTSYQLLQL